MLRRLLLVCLTLAFAVPAAAQLLQPAPDPPWIDGFRPGPGPGLEPPYARAAGQEWLLHRTADGVHPDGNEQALVWLMNRARQDPAEEGFWLATESHSDVAGGRSYFGVDVVLLEAELAAFAAAPPAAFDRRLYEASLAHSLDLIDRDAQDHDQQFDRVDASGFVHAGGRASVFSFTDTALHGHAAFNIDWGGNDGTGMQTGRGHRAAIMGDYTNVGIAMVPENDSGTSVGPLVTSAAYLYADTGTADHYNRFLVGTVWEDLDENGRYDPGEGFGGVTVMPSQGTFFAVTAEGGGYAIPMPASGDYDVTFSGGDLAGFHQRSVTIGPDSELLDLEPTPEPGLVLLLATGGLVLGATGTLRRRRSGARR